MSQLMQLSETKIPIEFLQAISIVFDSEVHQTVPLQEPYDSGQPSDEKVHMLEIAVYAPSAVLTLVIPIAEVYVI